MRRFIVVFVVLVWGSLLASGCSGLDAALGRSKSAPDEFEVVVRPPLTLPPGFNETPQNSASGGGASESSPQQRANAVSSSDAVLTNSASADASIFDSVFGTDERLSNIRTLVDEETYGIQLERRLPASILFGGRPNVGPNLNSAEEAERLREALERGVSPTSTPTSATDPIEGEAITVE